MTTTFFNAEVDVLDILKQLEQVIAARRAEQSEQSYTWQLLAGGVPAISVKIREESEEIIDAASRLQQLPIDSDQPEHQAAVVHEGADLIYHLLVLLNICDVTLDEVEGELLQRFGTSGLEEKARRDAEREPPPGD